MATIQETYGRYKPPGWVRPTIERLLTGVPAAYLSGLGTIVLTDSSVVGPGKTRRVGGRKYDRRACRGFYYRRHGGTPASIEIIVDNVLAAYPRFASAFAVSRDGVFAGVLFHELGHHLEVTVGAAAPSGEAAAEEWKRRLGRLYFQRRYRWLRPVARILRPVVHRLRRRAAKGAG